jgi:hypothetical protein
LLWPSIPAMPRKKSEDISTLQMPAWATWCCVKSNVLPISYRLNKNNQRYEEHIRKFLFENKPEICFRSRKVVLHYSQINFKDEFVRSIWTI